MNFRLPNSKPNLPSAPMVNTMLACMPIDVLLFCSKTMETGELQYFISFVDFDFRVSFVYVRALNQNGEDIPMKKLSIKPNQFLLNKLCFEPIVSSFKLILFIYQ